MQASQASVFFFTEAQDLLAVGRPANQRQICLSERGVGHAAPLASANVVSREKSPPRMGWHRASAGREGVCAQVRGGV